MKKGIDRTKGPLIREIEHIAIPDIEQSELSNQIPVYTISAGTQDVVKMDIIFSAGRVYEKKPLVSAACSKLLLEGTSHKTSKEISTLLDYYGAVLTSRSGMDISSITLHCLKKHFDQILPVILEILSDAQFPESELQQYKHNRRQRLAIELAKNEVQAYRVLTEKIFGADHAYGYNSKIELYDKLNQDDVMDHFLGTFGYNNCILILSGKIDADILNRIDKSFAGFSRCVEVNPGQLESPDESPERVLIETSNTFQSSIRIGRKFGTRKHPDYTKMFVLNAILGGYFGSRLMKNIREQKGYTYNIYSSLDTMKFDGYFYISTDVANEYIDPTLQEIYKELELLKRTPISQAELRILKNYLLGNALSMMDGPLNVSRLLKNLLALDLSIDYFNRFLHEIRNITSEGIIQMAQKYFDWEKMWFVIVGSGIAQQADK